MWEFADRHIISPFFIHRHPDFTIEQYIRFDYIRDERNDTVAEICKMRYRNSDKFKYIFMYEFTYDGNSCYEDIVFGKDTIGQIMKRVFPYTQITGVSNEILDMTLDNHGIGIITIS